ncbi:MAG: exosome complex exonuclease Rrp41 [Candidatus Aenigmarchaeota archaeon ex4484_56]|nr:MAG: exosome complex exonuclease Rrp41 [Candidatus Aenigmarchaeota archaeon ex4484_56]
MTEFKRLDGRKPDEIRKLKAKIGIVDNADGSAMFEMGNTIAIATIYGPMEVVPKFLEESDKAVLEINYQMLPFSTDERTKPGFSRRNTEISTIIKRLFENVIFLKDFPKTKILINLDVLSADASTRCCAINAASLALADAGIPMKDIIASCSVGKVDGNLIVDVAGKEDTEGEVDLPGAYIPVTNEILLLQMDGILKKEEFKQLKELLINSCKKIYDFQKTVLLNNKSVENILK